MLNKISMLTMVFALFLALPISAQPANDECVGAEPVDIGANAIDTTGATASADPYNDLNCPGTFLGAMAADCWYSFTPAESGLLNLTTCDPAGVDTDLGCKLCLT